MLIEMLLNLIKNILSITLVIEIPPLPATVEMYINEGLRYVSAGAGIIANYTPFSYLLVLLGIIIAVDAGILIYHFVMWILKKIPMAGIS